MNSTRAALIVLTAPTWVLAAIFGVPWPILLFLVLVYGAIIGAAW